MKRFLFLTIILTFVFLPHLGRAQETLGQSSTFNIESDYDLSKRTQLTATLIKFSPSIYWYLDDNWWKGLGSEQQNRVRESLNFLTEEFEGKIYPNLTQTFGQEWTPGIDKDSRITILVHPMKEDAGGYTNTADEYPKAQIPKSNEREMIYLNSQHINTNSAKAFLAHEFVHLITFNQKTKTYGVEEEIWLNEARADYAPTLLGYDQEYEGSNLRRRAIAFLDRLSDSLTEWKGNSSDYGVANLFIQYLVDHYGVEILADSLKMRKTGIASLNAALSREGYKTDFSQIFTDWTLAVLINDCQVSEKYCYNNANLKNFRITPSMNYLPLSGQSTLSVTNSTKDWAGNWHKFLGGAGILKLEFKGSAGANFKVLYVIEDSEDNISVGELRLDSSFSGKISINDFGSKNISLTIIPIAQNKVSNFSAAEPSRIFFWSASREEKEKTVSEMTRAEILAKIAELKVLIARLQAQLLALAGSQTSCQAITRDLYFGMENNSQVRCLQEFLKSQGQDIYPESLVTGNFYTLTEKAVIRFQEMYASEILTPLGLTHGTGYVGPSSRAKINGLLTK